MLQELLLGGGLRGITNVWFPQKLLIFSIRCVPVDLGVFLHKKPP